ncbi:HEAT repeat domain-containing protein [Cellulomonas sp. URHB0016]
MDSESAWLQLLALGDRPADELDDDAAFTLVRLLQKRGEPVVLEWALPALTEEDPWSRQAAAWVLGELGYEHGRPFAEQVVPALSSAARHERDAETRRWLVSALGRAEDPAWVPELLLYVDDDDPIVREHVARSLPIMFCGEELSPQAVAALISLSGDVDPGVRDWATFGLGTLSTLDGEEIRHALAERLDDDGGDTRFEASLGLARRGDDRARAAIRRRLDEGASTIYLLDLVAAAALADPALLPALGRLREDWAGDSDPHTEALDHAIDRCDPAAHLRAAAVQVALAEGVNRGLADIGWTVAADGAYPMTVLTVRRPDGTADGAERLWDGVGPSSFEIDDEIARWTATVRLAAAAGAPDA